MLPPGHAAFSYLLALVPSLFGKPLTLAEQFFVVFCSIVIDFDYIYALIVKKPGIRHHFFPTHTPLFALLEIFVFYFLLHNFFSPLAFVVGFASMISHFALDDISYWFYLIGITKENRRPQIFWLYPFDKRREFWLKKVKHDIPVIEGVKCYLRKEFKIFVIEIGLVVIAAAVFLLVNF